MAAFTFSTTFCGSGAELSWLVIFCPSLTIQSRKSAMIFPFFGSLAWTGIKSQVKLEMGYAVLPGAFVIETRKSAGIFGDEAAASVTASSEAFTKLPAAFLIDP